VWASSQSPAQQRYESLRLWSSLRCKDYIKTIKFVDRSCSEVCAVWKSASNCAQRSRGAYEVAFMLQYWNQHSLGSEQHIRTLNMVSKFTCWKFPSRQFKTMYLEDLEARDALQLLGQKYRNFQIDRRLEGAMPSPGVQIGASALKDSARLCWKLWTCPKHINEACRTQKN